MKTLNDTTKKKRSLKLSLSGCWRYVLDDLLELKFSLDPVKRLYLIKELEKNKLKGGSISTFTAVLFDRKLILITNGRTISEYWLYCPDREKIYKGKMRARGA